MDATLLVKLNGGADGGSVRLSGTYFRQAGGAPTHVAPDDNVTKLSPGLAGVVAALNINAVTNAVEIIVTPGAALTLDWRVVRTQTEGMS